MEEIPLNTKETPRLTDSELIDSILAPTPDETILGSREVIQIESLRMGSKNQVFWLTYT